jgi:hypothetical protein
MSKKPAISEELVTAPGGPRPRSLVHGVAPGEGVTMDPGGYPVIETRSPEGRGTEAAQDVVITPGGARQRGLVHMIEPGHVIDGSEGKLRKLSPSGEVAKDFGPLHQRPGGAPLMPHNVTHPPRASGAVPALGTGWITYAYWQNNTGKPITSFATTWVVPPFPATQSGQLIYLFNGIQNSTMIYQPVLQWGNNGAFGGNYWCVASWYADGQNGSAFHSQPVQVSPGQTLTGIMALTGQSGSAFSYSCAFAGIAGSSLPISNVEELTWCAQTLEAYNLTKCSDYPNTDDTAMAAIDIQTSDVRPALGWTSATPVSDCGQHTVVASNANPGGAVDLYYRVPLAWLDNVTVTQTFATTEPQNAWAYFQGYGWRKIQQGAADGVTNMLAVFAQAVAKGRPVTVYADGSLVYQAYLL